MQRRNNAGDGGQSLIQFTLIILVLMAFASLALDAGAGLATRRKLQNAADAAALAAARELCLGRDPETAKTTASTYLVNNGAMAIGAIGSSNSAITFSNNNTRVNITAKGQAKTIFGDLITEQEIDVEAFANSACGAAKSACGLWPIIFSADLWQKIPCGKTVAVWDKNNPNKQVECTIGGKIESNICKCYDCDSQDIGIDDFLVVSDVSRGWLDFPVTDDARYPDVCKEAGSGANELKCTIRNDFQGLIKLPKWITALNGVKASGLKEVEDRIGDEVRIPLYTNLDAPGTEPDRDVDEFYVGKFGCATVDGVEKKATLNPLPGMPKSYKKVTMTVVMVTKSCGMCTTACGTTDGTPGEPWELRAANIVR